MSRVFLVSFSVLLFVAAGFALLSFAEQAAAQVPPLCNNTADDDGDTVVNDGCPIVGTQGEDSWQCNNNLDDDGDTVVNDGCGGASPPAAGPMGQPEVDSTCANATDDDDLDGKINDGCPAVGAAETGTQCDDAADNDGDTKVNDGCYPGGVTNTERTCVQRSEGDDGVRNPTNQCDDPVPPGTADDNDCDGAIAGNLNDGCPAVKPTTDYGLSVGGIAELPDVASDSGSSAGTYAALTGGLAAAVLALTAGAWYARRRWMR